MKPKKSKGKKFTGYKLHNGLYEIYWVNDRAVSVTIEGQIFFDKEFLRKQNRYNKHI